MIGPSSAASGFRKLLPVIARVSVPLSSARPGPGEQPLRWLVCRPGRQPDQHGQDNPEAGRTPTACSHPGGSLDRALAGVEGPGTPMTQPGNGS
jgi:hypothetical protein